MMGVQTHQPHRALRKWRERTAAVWSLLSHIEMLLQVQKYKMCGQTLENKQIDGNKIDL